MPYIKQKHYVGDVRPSQLLWTHGVGSIIDLPHISTIVMGLDDWDTSRSSEIHEERLLKAIQSILGRQVASLRMPPIDEQSTTSSTVGVPVATFPRWLVCPACHLLAPFDSGYFDLRANSYFPDKARYCHKNCQKSPGAPTTYPARFMIACEAGHLDDFPWHHFVHQGSDCKSVLRLEERGVTGEVSDIWISCDICKKGRTMAHAFSRSDEERSYHPTCTGYSPHLRKKKRNGCQEKAHPILLSASNAWFPLVYNSLALPRREDPLGALVEKHWSILAVASSQAIVDNFLLIQDIKKDLGHYPSEEIWHYIEAKRQGESAAAPISPADLRVPEWHTLSNPQQAPGSEDFQVVRADTPPEYADLIEQVILVERLREVRALTGFTRIESLIDYVEEEEKKKQHVMSLANKGPYWVPAAEVRGEGIFLQLREEAIQEWLRKPAVRQYGDLFKAAHRHWRQARKLEDPEAHYPELRYILLHSLAHALMRQLALECGYSAASIRERIYAQGADKAGGAMAGILLYTADSDSEGTLGGLVSRGKDMGYHIAGALEGILYCASDPLCSEHIPSADLTLHGAACHACLFSPETSCERGNRYLDRSLLIPTIERSDLAFFDEIRG